MDIRIIVSWISAFIWLFPPFKQKGTQFFYFFLIYAISDPLRLLLLQGFGIKVWVLIIIINSLVVASLLKPKSKQILLAAVSIIVTIAFLLLGVPKLYYDLSSTLLHFVIVLLLVVKLTDQMVLDKSLNMFLVLLLVYEGITVLKRIAALIDPKFGYYTFSFGTASQIMFALLFIFINIDTKSYKLIPEE
jgi:hypothetical protein